MQGIFQELKRRNVFRVGMAYLALAWLVVQVTDMAVPALNLPPSLNSIVFYIGLIGFPFALFFAWAFELTPEGIKPEREATPKETSTGATGRYLNRFTIVALTLALVFVIVDQYILEESNVVSAVATPPSGGSGLGQQGVEPSIAVLPFENFSGNEEDDYFSDGLSDTVLHQLAQVPGLKVIARNSTFQFKGTNLDVREIGERLGVFSLLEGSVQRYGSDIRVIAQLVRTSDGAHLWSQSFDYQMSNIFALHDAIATAVVKQMALTLLPGDTADITLGGTEIPEAYDLYLRARAGVESGFSPSLVDNIDSVGDFEPVQLLQRALALDPDYVDAMIELASIYNGFAWLSSDMARYAQYLDLARPLVDRAMQIAPTYSGAWVAKGSLEHRSGNELAAIASHKKAIELNPNDAEAHKSLAIALIERDPQKTIEHMRIFRELNPAETFDRPIVMALLNLGRTDEAIERLEKGLEDPDDNQLQLSDLASLHFWIQGKPAEAARRDSELLAIAPDNVSAWIGLARCWLAVDDLERADLWLTAAASKWPGSDALKSYKLRLDLARRDSDRAWETLAETEGWPGLPGVEENYWRTALCLIKGDIPCARAANAALETALEKAEASGKQNEAVNAKQRLFSAEIQQRSGEEPTAEVQGVLAAIDSFKRAAWFTADRGYLAAEATILLQQQERAMNALEDTLLPEGGYIAWDSFGLPADRGLVVSRLKGHAPFDEWLRRYHERQSTARQAMLEMERNGKIHRPPSATQ